MEERYKALMYGFKFVEFGLLSGGIYTAVTPNLFEKDCTIDFLIERSNTNKDVCGNSFYTDVFFENLKKCKLVDVAIIKIDAQ
jgi:hypothetical protein